MKIFITFFKTDNLNRPIFKLLGTFNNMEQAITHSRKTINGSFGLSTEKQATMNNIQWDNL